jgi:predicted AlkP superfamily pyrophosphatase or phosphodiesterase
MHSSVRRLQRLAITLRRLWTVCAALIALALAVPAGIGQSRQKPILVLVSFDGWRWDYMNRARVPHLQALAARGVRATALVPAFPSLTFPNHYTIVTGLYPEHHGIVANAMIDPQIDERFTMSSETAKDGRWWSGEPIWVTAIRQGQRAASMFWAGSEASIGGIRPTFWRAFDDTLPNADRVKQVLEWLARPPDQQPSFITVYFSEVDHAGHTYGPDSPELFEAAGHLDEALGQLVAGAASLGLSDRLDIVVVSDHGMAALDANRRILIDDYLMPGTVDVVEWGAVLGLQPRIGSVENVYRALKGKHPALSVFKRDQIPARLHYRDNARIPPVVGIADLGWTVTSRERLQADREAGRTPSRGGHGYDPRHKEMHGLFVAAGPHIREHLVVGEFDNVHLYDFLCRLLDVKPAPNDGNPEVTRRFLR